LTLYLDTSALVKLYVEETGSSIVREAVEEAEAVASSIIAYVEARAAFARRQRERTITLPAYKRLLRDFEADWRRYLVIEATELLVRRAAELAETHRLRAYDSIHLASASILKENLNDSVSFTSWDSQLQAAARREGLTPTRISQI
jgi:predicted nucleic acid-binding protein